MLNRSAAVRALIGAVISVVALWLVLRSVDLARTLEILGSAAPGWIVAAGGFIVVDVMLRGLRWQRLIAPLGRVPYRSMLGYLLIGYLANNLLPARLGELVRSHYLGDREGISRTSTLGTVVVERVVDLSVVVAIAAAAILILSVRGIVANAVLVGVAVAALFALILAFGVAAHRLPGAGRVATLADGWPQVRDAVANLRGGLGVAARPRTVLETVVLSALAWTATILAFAAAGQAVGIELTIGQAALLGSGVALASAIPAGPASLGTFELAAVQIATSIGVPENEAFAIALIAHAASLLITVPSGAVVLARIGWRRDRSASAAEA